MSRRYQSDKEQARRAKLRELLQESNISSMRISKIFSRRRLQIFWKNGLDAELEDELGYSRYDYKNKSKTIAKTAIAVVLLDAIHYNIRSEGQIINKTV